jgi:hypothetical protein
MRTGNNERRSNRRRVHEEELSITQSNKSLILAIHKSL